MGITIRAMSVDEFRADTFVPLFDAYEADAGLDGFRGWRLRFDDYKVIERTGMLRLFAAFDGDKPVGVASCILMRTLQYDEPTMVIDAIFALPDRRAEGVGSRLMAAAIREAKAWGAKVVTISCGPNSVLHKELEKSSKFKVSRINYNRRIG